MDVADGPVPNMLGESERVALRLHEEKSATGALSLSLMWSAAVGAAEIAKGSVSFLCLGDKSPFILAPVGCCIRDGGFRTSNQIKLQSKYCAAKEASNILNLYSFAVESSNQQWKFHRLPRILHQLPRTPVIVGAYFGIVNAAASGAAVAAFAASIPTLKIMGRHGSINKKEKGMVANEQSVELIGI
ncbi:Uncharacterized protein Fot_20187 [Forsythia ovata]|uniref:Uncharacterized protein n=1 Tax=Forsythia ovata TaxID=205694 RepID=A0ABD1VN71_9LAMI